MGCTNTRDNIEAKMLELKLRRIQIRKERMQRCQELSKFTGQIVKRKPIKNFLVSKRFQYRFKIRNKIYPKKYLRKINGAQTKEILMITFL